MLTEEKKQWDISIDTVNLIKIILVRHTSYNEDDLEAPSSAINK
jgi:hypothetical protein